MALRYPENTQNCKDYIKFEFGDYSSPFKSSAVQKAIVDYKSTVSFTSKGDPIYLPMPADIGSSFSGNWGGKDVTGLAQFALGTGGQAAGELIQKGNVKGALDNLLKAASPDSLKSAVGALSADALTALGNGFSGLPGLGGNLSANDVLQLTTESIVNPNTELLYNGSDLRTHGYSFKMIAQSEQESNNILEIVNAFKKACAPKNKNTIAQGAFRNFIGIPDICRVTFVSQEHPNGNPYLPRYKESAILSVNVNYVTDGQFISYKNGDPLGVILTVSFKELKLVFSEEIGTYR